MSELDMGVGIQLTDAQLLLKDAQERYEEIANNPSESWRLAKGTSFFSPPDYMIVGPLGFDYGRYVYRQPLSSGPIKVALSGRRYWFSIGSINRTSDLGEFESDTKIADIVHQAEMNKTNDKMSRLARKLRKKERKTKSKNLNVVQEVGRDPLRIPNTPIYQGLKHVDDMSGCEVGQLGPCLDDLMDEG